MNFHSNSSLVVGALLLAGIWTVAPAASGAPARKAQSSQPANIAVDHAGGNGVQRPDTARSNKDPLYEGKGQADVKRGSGVSVIEYKDPEDMTTRKRPGKNETTGSSSAADHAGGNSVRPTDVGQHAGTSGNPTPSADAHNTKKHLAGVKYEDRTSGGGNRARGFAINEQGGSTAPAKRRH